MALLLPRFIARHAKLSKVLALPSTAAALQEEGSLAAQLAGAAKKSESLAGLAG